MHTLQCRYIQARGSRHGRLKSQGGYCPPLMGFEEFRRKERRKKKRRNATLRKSNLDETAGGLPYLVDGRHGRCRKSTVYFLVSRDLPCLAGNPGRP
jgi:hypothetical protein